MNRDLIFVWVVVPENVSIYRFTNLTDEERKKLKDSHGKCINTADNEPPDAEWLNEWLVTRSGDKVYDEIDGGGIGDPLSLGPCDLVVSGFIM